MTSKLIAACLQLNARPAIVDNLALIAPMLDEARQRGAEFITLPENCDLMIKDRAKRLELACSEHDHPALPFFKHAAMTHQAWILAGSIAVKTDSEHLANRSFLFAPDGTIAARYDKIHMFDADLGGNECYHESATFRPGDKAVIATTPWGKIGLTICYDMRFAALHCALAKAGASIITSPAAFTVPTGKLHWHTLLRARAIETGCYVIAAGQCGVHDGGRATYGHSLIVAPSGAVIAEAGDTPAVITAELDLALVAATRRRLPSLQHERVFSGP